MAVAHFEAKGVSVPTVAEGRWATLLARHAVTTAHEQKGLEAKVHGEKPGEAEHGDKLNEGGVDPQQGQRRNRLGRRGLQSKGHGSFGDWRGRRQKLRDRDGAARVCHRQPRHGGGCRE
ncbi:hypothetical protein MTO96_039949 [Rhipicephalus appendiculatus]